MPFRHLPRPASAFTLIELLVVITIIVILMGLLFPAFRGVQDQGKRAQAKNDLTQIITAINAFYTEYGQYPCGPQTGADGSDYYTNNDKDRRDLMDLLRVPYAATPPVLNPRGIAFLQVPSVKNDTAGQRRSGIGNSGIFYDPWGNPYTVKIDNNYNNVIENPYTENTGAGAGLNLGAIAWSLGKDADGAKTGAKGSGGPKNSGKSEDDVISWL